MSTRYFTAAADTYGSIASQLDQAYGYPNPETRTDRALPPVSDLPSKGGRVYLAVDASYCDYVLPSELLPQLISSGQVAEITEAEYSAAVPSPL